MIKFQNAYKALLKSTSFQLNDDYKRLLEEMNGINFVNNYTVDDDIWDDVIDFELNNFNSLISMMNTPMPYESFAVHMDFQAFYKAIHPGIADSIDSDRYLSIFYHKGKIVIATAIQEDDSILGPFVYGKHNIIKDNSIIERLFGMDLLGIPQEVNGKKLFEKDFNEYERNKYGFFLGSNSKHHTEYAYSTIFSYSCDALYSPKTMPSYEEFILEKMNGNTSISRQPMHDLMNSAIGEFRYLYMILAYMQRAKKVNIVEMPAVRRRVGKNFISSPAHRRIIKRTTKEVDRLVYSDPLQSLAVPRRQHDVDPTWVHYDLDEDCDHEWHNIEGGSIPRQYCALCTGRRSRRRRHKRGDPAVGILPSREKVIRQ